MVTWQKWAVAAVVLAIGIGMMHVFSPSPENRIKKQFDVLAAHIGKAPNQNPLLTAANAKRLREVFAETITLQAPAYDYRRELQSSELPALVLTATAPYSELSLSFHDLAFAFPSPDEARVGTTSRTRGRLSGDDWIEDVQELDCRFRRIDDVWRLEAIEVVEVLQR